MPEEVQCQEEAQGGHGPAPILPSSCPGGPQAGSGSVSGTWRRGGGRRSPPSLCPFTCPDQRVLDAVTAQRVSTLPWVQSWPLRHPEDGSTGPEQVL